MKHNPYRRAFMRNTGVAAAGLALGSNIANALENNAQMPSQLGRIVCASPQAASFIAGKGHKIEHNFFFVYDMDKKQHSELEIPIGVSHDTVLHPINTTQALVIEKDGPYACLVDFEQMKVLKRINAAPEHYFTGHGTYSPDGQKIYFGHYVRGRLDLGHILVLDGSSFEEIARIDTNGIQPHAFSWFPDKRHVAIGHYGLPAHHTRSNLRSMVVIYDTKNDRVVNEIKAPLPNLYLCHIEVTKQGKLFVLTHDSLLKSDPEALKINKLKNDYNAFVKARPNYFDFSLHPSPILFVADPMKSTKFDVNVTREGFSWGLSLVSNYKTNIVGGTHGAGTSISFQNLKSGELVKEHVFEKEQARALVVTTDQRYFVALTDKGNFHYFDAQTLNISHTESPAKGHYNLVVHAKCAPPKLS